jgi:DeoR family ulaG and ulaABCDEF operon transcriptional repressor
VLSATGASEASVRRDFAKLAEIGVAIRVHGGLEAAPAMARAADIAPLATRSFEVSRTLNVAAKRAIARAAVDLCEDGEAIIINGGTTTFEMGEFLRERRLKVLTNSYPLAEALIRDSKCRVALPGGEVYREQKLIVSPFEEDAIQHYSATRMFMSAIAIGPLGVIEGDPLIARAETKLLKRAEKLIVLADSTKFTPAGSLVVCPLSRVSTLITDPGAPAAALDMLREAGIRTIIVDVAQNATAAA